MYLIGIIYKHIWNTYENFIVRDGMGSKSRPIKSYSVSGVERIHSSYLSSEQAIVNPT